jgi:putative FmdB family regulatory protein
MPIYDFKCSKASCDHSFEKLVTEKNTPDHSVTALCPKCQSPAHQYLPPGSRDAVKFLFNYMEN